MGRYINADKLIKDLNLARIIQKPRLLDYEETIEIIKMSSTEIEEIKHGEWTEQEAPYVNTYECSNCKRWFVLEDGTPEENNYNYCPNCGADMRGEKK